MVHYPGGVSTFAAVSLFNLYALKPSNWFVMQAVIMMVFYLHRKAVAKQEACLIQCEAASSRIVSGLGFPDGYRSGDDAGRALLTNGYKERNNSYWFFRRPRIKIMPSRFYSGTGL